MFIIIGQSLPSRLVTQKLTLQKSQIIIVAIMKHMEEGGLYTRRHLNKELRLVVVIEYLNSGYNKKLTKIYHFICSNKNDSLVNHICKYKQFTQKYTKLLSQHTNHTIIIHFCPD